MLKYLYIISIISNVRYYFKTKVEGDLYYEEVREDSSQVPRWQGKVWVECHHQP